MHINDDRISENPCSVALWDIEPMNLVEGDNTLNPGESVGSARGYRYFLLLQTGPNSSGNNCLFIGGLELYGVLLEKRPLQAMPSPQNN